MILRRGTVRWLGFLAGLCAGLVALAVYGWMHSVPRIELLVFLEKQGCVIGPATRQAAREAGFPDPEIENLAQRASRVGKAEMQGEWLLLSPQICTIRPPEIKTALRLDDPELLASLSARDAYAEEGRPGCYLFPRSLIGMLRNRPGWDDDRAQLEYTRLLGAALLSGEATFHSSNPDVLPRGFQLMTGECGEVPARTAIAQSHDVLIEHFDPLIRFAGEITVCKERASPESGLVRLMAERLSGQRGGNAWLAMELQMIAEGAGWYEGMGPTGNDTPRPPFCHYE